MLAVGALAAYLAFRWVFSLIRLPANTPSWAIGLGFAASAAGAIGLPIVAICMLVRVVRTAGAALLVAVVGAALWLGLAFSGFRPPPHLGGIYSGVQDLGKILLASGVGVALSQGIKEPNILLPAGAFAAFADFVVVKFGTVKHALAPGNAKGQALVQAVSAKVPVIHASLSLITIGPADFLFLGILLACAARFGLGLKRNGWILAAVLTLSLLLVPLVGAIPALAPMCLAFLIFNWRRFNLTRQEILSTAAVLVLAGGLFLGYFLFIFPAKR